MAPEIVLGEARSIGAPTSTRSAASPTILLTGQLVFEADTPMKMFVAASCRRKPMPPSQRTELPIPRELDDLVLACLEKDPRQATAGC